MTLEERAILIAKAAPGYDQPVYTVALQMLREVEEAAEERGYELRRAGESDF